MNILPAQPEPDPLKGTAKYQKVKSLGKGSFGFVQLGKVIATGELVAIKFLKRGDVNKYVEAEIVNHSLLRHPHVIQFKEVFLLPDYICIAMEYAVGGSLFHYVQNQGKLNETLARWFFQQLMIGIDYCHKRGVVNRDIKLENTLLQENNGLPLPLVKICDFGYSKADFKSAAKSKVGTLTYMAPEVLINTEGKYDGKMADIWSCGVMLYVMLFGRYPFESPASGTISRANEILKMLEKMVNRKYPMPENVELTPECRDLLTRLLLPDPNQRITMADVMKHPWFVANLPAAAANMNAGYLNAAFPPGYQKPEDIHKLLEDAKRKELGRKPSEGADEAFEQAFDEEMAKSAAACSQVRQFIQKQKK